MYRLLRLGVGLAEQDETPSVRLDWLLAIDGVVNKLEREAAGG